MKEQNFVKIPYMHGVEGESSIAFIDTPFKTNDGIVKRYPDDIFGEWLITEIYDKIKIFAIKKGVFKPKYLCSSCKQELNIDNKRPIQTEYQLKLKELPPFIIRITIPSVECPKCKKICGIDPDGRVSFNLSEAIIHAFESEHIKP